MFNGYHEPPATSYNDLELERGKKNQSASKWPCGHGTNVQPSHLQSQNLQPEIWSSKPPFIGLSHSVNVAHKCNCPGCYQTPENQGYPGDLTWHRTWFSRAYPVPVNPPHDAKLQGNHRWENSGLPTEPYPESSQYIQESGEKSLFYKTYPSLRHADIYQTGVISTVKSCRVRTDDLPKQDLPDVSQRLAPAAAYDPFRDRRRIEDGNFFNNSLESCPHQAGLTQYHLHPNKRTILESFSKPVPSNVENRVPSVDHPNTKENVLHSYVDQNGIGKINQLPEDKLSRLMPEQGQENHNFQSEYHAFNRDFAVDKKFINGRHPQYFPRNNFPEMIKRTTQTFMLNRKDYNKKSVINPPRTQGLVNPHIPSNIPHSPSYGKFSLNDCSMPEKITSVINHKSPGGFQGREEMQHNHILRQQIDSEKGYMPFQNKSCRRPEYYRRNMWNEMPVDQQGIPNFPDLRNGLDPYGHQGEKQHYQTPNDIKSQTPLYVNPQMPPEMDTFRQTEKENTDKISHLESIRYEELCKNGTSKISPLRLLRKKKFNHQKKENVVESTTADARTEAPPLDVRRFWATWAEEEEENVPQTQMVVLDCHNIDPEQAGLLNLYNAEPIRTVHLEDGSFLRTQLDKPSVESKILDFENAADVVRPESAVDETKKSKNPELPFGMPLYVESDPGITKPYSTDEDYQKTAEEDIKTDVKQFEMFKHCENNLELELNESGHGKCDDSETAVLLKKDNLDSENISESANFMKEEHVGIDDDATKRSVASGSTNDSQTDLPDPPTSEYRKNKFLDYSEPSLLSLEAHHNEPAKTFELLPGNFELDEILKKLSVINFQSPESSSEAQHKTDNKKQLTKTKKPCCKSSRSDEMTPQNISLTKPTIKFSIQKSHDLKISFKVLNKKYEDESEAREVDQDHSEDKEEAEGANKSRRRLITLKLKDLSEKDDDNCRKNKGSDDLRKIRKAMKKKKMRSERPSSPKTPILKIKKSRYMLTDGCDEVPETVSDEVSSEAGAHDDFQVHETVESAKIKLTFKRNKNNVVKKIKYSEDKELNFQGDHPQVTGEDTESPSRNESPEETPLKCDSAEDITEEPQDDIGTPERDIAIENPESTFAPESISVSTNLSVIPESEIAENAVEGDPPPEPEKACSVMEMSGECEETKLEDRTEEKVCDLAVALETKSVEKEKSEEHENVPEEELEKPNQQCVEIDIPVVTEEPEGTAPFQSNDTKDDPSDTVGEMEPPISPQSKNDVQHEEAVKDYPNTEQTIQTDTVEKMDNSSSDIIEDKNDDEGVTESVEVKTDEKPPAEETDLMEDSVKDITEHEKLTAETEEMKDVEEKLPEEIIMAEDGPEEGELVTETEDVKDIEEKLSEEMIIGDDSPEEGELVTDAEDTKDTPEEKLSEEVTIDDHPKDDELAAEGELNENKTFAAEIEDLNILPDEKLAEIEMKENDSDQVQLTAEAEDLNNIKQDEKIIEEKEIEEDGPEEGELIEDETEDDHVDKDEISIIENIVTISESVGSNPEDINDVEMESESFLEEQTVEDAENMEVVEENNNIITRDKIIFVDRMIVRRRSCETQEQMPNKRLRSISVNIDLKLTETQSCAIEEEISVLDIPVCDIPLPPGDAPAENCINWEEYFKKKLTDVEVENFKKPSSPDKKASHMPEEVMVKDHVVDMELVSMVPEQDEKATVNLGIEEFPDDLGPEFPEIEQGKEIVHEETLLCECEGLAFDENLTITDDMEEEKVSDDDKFRDMMQNCLDNAKKFLSVGNVKLSSVDDHSEESKNLDDPLEVTDFVSDPDALPVDNWPYLEEEVPSSPNKADDSDLLCLDDIFSDSVQKSRRVSLSEIDNASKTAPLRRRTIEGISRWKSFHDSSEEVCDYDDSKRSSRCGGDSSKKVLKKDSNRLYYKSSSWQPKVVLFRISKNVMERLPTKKFPKEKMSVERIREILTQDEGVKVKKKHRFRNLHVKKKIVPDRSEITKDKQVDSDASDPRKEDAVERRKSDERAKSDHKKHSERYKRKREHGEEEYKEHSRENGRRPDEVDKRSKRNERHTWSCEVCGFNKSSERATHVQNHPFHCQSCHLAFKTEANFVDHLTRKHKDIRNQHHCLLCELSFDLAKDYYNHLETREHRHLEAVEKNTINTLFTLLTGHPCPVLGPVESKPEWLPTQAGTVHFYHQATPLSLALQYLKLHDKKNLSTTTLSPQ